MLEEFTTGRMKLGVLESNLPLCHIVHHKSQLAYCGIEPWPLS